MDQVQRRRDEPPGRPAAGASDRRIV